MRRLLRWQFNLAASASAVLFLGVCVLWLRSYAAPDELSIWIPSPARLEFTNLAAASYRGRVDWWRFWSPSADRAEFDRRMGALAFLDETRTARHLGPLRLSHDHTEVPAGPALRLGFNLIDNRFPSLRQTVLTVPDWFMAAVFAAPPALWFFARLLPNRRRQLRLNSGRCTSCGYDLRGTPTRCPECGGVPSSRPQSPT